VSNSLRLRSFAPLPENRDATTAVPAGSPSRDRTRLGTAR
jgi:Cu+-exporting ATPase